MRHILIFVFLTIIITLKIHGIDTRSHHPSLNKRSILKKAGISCKEEAKIKCAGRKTPAEFIRCWKGKVKNCRPKLPVFASRIMPVCNIVQVEKEEYLYFEGQYYKVLYKVPVLVCL
uniref:Cnidarian restricted protein n=1 Tax=Clytia hemisphaerica TaxID=252671 RepID=A0A7M5UUP7_9CNID|eukprot:TCONS_00065638-protein